MSQLTPIRPYLWGGGAEPSTMSKSIHFRLTYNICKCAFDISVPFKSWCGEGVYGTPCIQD